MTETSIDRMLRVAREVQPDLWKRTEGVARVIDPGAFCDDWIIEPASSAKLFAAKQALQRSIAMSKAQEILTYLGVNTETDWHEILTRLVKPEAA